MSYKSDFVSKGGHNYTAVTTQPSCIKRGYTVYTCECGASYKSDFTSKGGHNYVATVTNPTCTKRGYTTYACECGMSYVGDPVKALGHTPGASATCTTEQKCEACGTVIAPALGHNYIDRVCTRCNGISPSEGLNFVSNGDGTCYVMKGTCTDTDVVIPSVSPNGETVTGIGKEAFRNCSSLTSVVIGDSVTSIGGYAFFNCSSLTSIEIPDSVTSIGDSAFDLCSSLTSIVVDENNTTYSSIDGNLYNKDA
ncbi:MAG: leucine-rich repeat domain-containing protein, partial [Ruminococcaceae bacterium]|nr:leucine-rich repeat domain-containing protein [Oscillospiraceae bacterium]